MRRSGTVVVFLAGAVIAFSTCSGISKPAATAPAVCERPSVCGAGPPPTPGNRDHCAEALIDPGCGPVYQIALACVQKHEACTTDGRTDVAITDDACAAELAAAFNTPSCFAILGQDALDGGDADAAVDADAEAAVDTAVVMAASPTNAAP